MLFKTMVQKLLSFFVYEWYAAKEYGNVVVAIFFSLKIAIRMPKSIPGKRVFLILYLYLVDFILSVQKCYGYLQTHKLCSSSNTGLRSKLQDQ